MSWLHRWAECLHYPECNSTTRWRAGPVGVMLMSGNRYRVNGLHLIKSTKSDELLLISHMKEVRWTDFDVSAEGHVFLSWAALNKKCLKSWLPLISTLQRSAWSVLSVLSCPGITQKYPAVSPATTHVWKSSWTTFPWSFYTEVTPTTPPPPFCVVTLKPLHLHLVSIGRWTTSLKPPEQWVDFCFMYLLNCLWTVMFVVVLFKEWNAIVLVNGWSQLGFSFHVRHLEDQACSWRPCAAVNLSCCWFPLPH